MIHSRLSRGLLFLPSQTKFNVFYFATIFHGHILTLLAFSIFSDPFDDL